MQEPLLAGVEADLIFLAYPLPLKPILEHEVYLQFQVISFLVVLPMSTFPILLSIKLHI